MASDTPVHILVADDDVLIAWALRSILEEAGYRVTVAHDGEQALALQARDPADVLLTDLQMPRLDGHGLIRELRAEYPMLPVIVMTGAPNASGLTGLRGGAAAGTIIMAKPVGPQPVLAALRDLLQVR